jgi:hypothetical protein
MSDSVFSFDKKIFSLETIRMTFVDQGALPTSATCCEARAAAVYRKFPQRAFFSYSFVFNMLSFYFFGWSNLLFCSSFNVRSGVEDDLSFSTNNYKNRGSSKNPVDTLNPVSHSNLFVVRDRINVTGEKGDGDPGRGERNEKAFETANKCEHSFGKERTRCKQA